MDDATLPLSAEERKPQPRKVCSVEGCGKAFWARGYCGTHYQKFRTSAHFTLAWNVGTPAERFHRSYQIDPETGCWNWTEYCHPKGYGIFPMPPRNRQIKAHRFSYELHVGPIPAGLHACHRCDNRRCCNPDHIFLGTARDNARDMVEKGRQAVHTRKMTWAKVTQFRVLFARGKHSCSLLSGIYGIDAEQGRKILKGEAWLRPPG